MRFFARVPLALGIVTLAFTLGCNRQAGTVAAKPDEPAAFKKYQTGRPPIELRGRPKPGEMKRLILLTNGDVPFWDAMRSGMEDAARDFNLAHGGLKVEMDKNDGTPKGQIDKLTQYANQTDIAAVAISATDAKSTQMADAMRRLLKQGIAVITVDSDVDRRAARDARFAYFGTDNVIGGRELGKAAKGLRPDGGKYAAFVGLKSAANAQERMEGFAEGAGDKLQQIEYLGDDMDSAVAQKNVRDALDRHPEIDTLVGIWSYNANGIAVAVDQLGLRDKTAVVCFDADPLAIRHMDSGLIDALVVQNPYQMGYDGTRLMKALIEEDTATIKSILPGWDPASDVFTKPDADLVITGLKVVVPNEKTQLKPEMFESTTQFLKLGDFKKWLADHKLTGS